MTHHRRRSPTGVSRETLEEAPRRVFAFLCGVAGAPLAHAVLRKHGYTAAQHQRGWELLQQAVGSIVDDTVVDQTSVEALAELDAWDEQGIALIGAHLTRYPAIRDRVLSGLTAATGVEAMLNVKTGRRRPRRARASVQALVRRERAGAPAQARRPRAVLEHWPRRRPVLRRGPLPRGAGRPA